MTTPHNDLSTGQDNADYSRLIRPVTGRWRFWLLLVGIVAAPILHAYSEPAAAAGQTETETGKRQASAKPPEITPIAGEAFHTEFMGRPVNIAPRDRRSATAWSLGLDVAPGINRSVSNSEGVVTPGINGRLSSAERAITPGTNPREFTPLLALYFWRHRSQDSLLRATVAGAYNDVFYAFSPHGAGPWEAVFSFQDLAVPVDRAEYVDGTRVKGQELDWGYVRGGAGLGWRRQVSPGHEDNMLAFSLRVEPGYFFFKHASSDSDNFVTPQNNVETRLHARFRWDALTRNLLGLAHRGFALGADAVVAHRSDWDDWGLDGSEDGSRHRNYAYVTAYLRTASGVPGLNERHRFLTSLHAGVGNNLDRFSAPRLGGGPSSDEYGAVSRPVIPGALIKVFYPDHYAVATATYRYQATFFSYLGLHTSVAYLDRNRLQDDGIRRSEDVLGSIGARLTTGFVFNTRLQLEYDYNAGVVRRSNFGGHAVLLLLSGKF